MASTQVAQPYSAGRLCHLKGIGRKSIGEAQSWIMAGKE
jgi:hypothetical protein